MIKTPKNSHKCSLGPPEDISKEFEVATCNIFVLADFKILENLNFEIPASLILTKFSRFYRSTMTSQVFCQNFPNENLAERLAHLAHNLKVLSSIPGREFFKSFFLFKFGFFQNNFMFCAILNIKHHYKCFLSLKNGN